MQRIGGIIEIVADGVRIAAKGSFTYNLGIPQKTSVIGAEEPLGYTEAAKAAYIEGETVHLSELDLAALVRMNNATVDLTLPNGRVFVMREAFYAGDGEGSTEEGAVKVRFESKSAELI